MRAAKTNASCCPACRASLRDSGELDSIGGSGAAENVQAGADTISASVPDAISAVLGIAGDFFGIFLAGFIRIIGR